MKKRNDDYGLAGFGGGGFLDEAWVGAALGAATQSGAAAATRAFSSYDKWSEAIGAAAGLAVGAALYFTNYRESGKVAMAVAVANGVVRVAEKFLAGSDTKGVGYAQINPAHVFQGGLGIATMDPTHVFNGSQFAGPPQLAGGFGALPGAHQAQLEGGPATSSLAGMYGATLFGGN